MNHVPCASFEDIIPLIVTGGATAAEEALWSEHEKTNCEACTSYYQDMMEVPLEWARSTQSLVPPPAIKQRLLAAIDAEAGMAPILAFPKKRKVPFIRESIAWSLAASFLIMVVTLYQSTIDLKINVAKQDFQISSLQNRLAEKENMLASLKEKQTQLVSLQGLPASPSASGRVFWNAQNSTGYFVAFDLPPLPEGKVYQLWTIANGSAPVGAGVFSPDSLKSGLLKIDHAANPSSVQVFAVTIEPSGGSPQPTGDMYLKGGI